MYDPQPIEFRFWNQSTECTDSSNFVEFRDIVVHV